MSSSTWYVFVDDCNWSMGCIDAMVAADVGVVVVSVVSVGLADCTAVSFVSCRCSIVVVSRLGVDAE